MAPGRRGRQPDRRRGAAVFFSLIRVIAKLRGALGAAPKAQERANARSIKQHAKRRAVSFYPAERDKH